VDFSNATLSEDLPGVVLRYPGAGHDDDSPSASAMKLLDQIKPRFSCRLLAAG